MIYNFFYPDVDTIDLESLDVEERAIFNDMLRYARKITKPSDFSSILQKFSEPALTLGREKYGQELPKGYPLCRIVLDMTMRVASQYGQIREGQTLEGALRKMVHSVS